MSDHLSGKRVFVTGADGFIGSHLVETLVKAGAKVKALVYYNSWGNVGWLSDVPESIFKEIELYFGDIRDFERVKQGVKGCDYVFHLASLIAIPYSYDAPRSYVETNILGGLNILQACKESETLTRLLHVSTSEVYGSAQSVPISEAHPLVGQSPYSASKISADKMAESFSLSFGLPVVTARPFNTYGPRQTSRAVIPTIISQLISGRRQLKLGSLNPTRDFNFVSDTVRGMIALALCPKADGLAVNIGSGEEWSVGKTLEILCEITGSQPEVICDDSRIRPERSEVSRLLADNSKIFELTRWKSEVAFREGLELTVRWVEKNIHYFDAETYTK